MLIIFELLDTEVSLLFDQQIVYQLLLVGLFDLYIALHVLDLIHLLDALPHSGTGPHAVLLTPGLQTLLDHKIDTYIG